MAEVTYFVGPEFDWLRNQVVAVLWNPSGARVKMSEAAERQSAAAGQKCLSNLVTKKRSAPLTVLEDAVTLTWQSTAPQTAAMSVEEYNRWRGENPANAAHAPYVFQKYPTTLYKDGNRIKVGNADDHDRLAQEGWKESP